MINPIQKKNRYAYFIFISVAVPYILVYFHRIAPAVIANDIIQTFQITATEFSHLSASYFYIYTILQIVVGVLVDSIGSRKIIFYGSLLSGVGSIIFGFSESFVFAIIGRFLVGLGVSGIFISILKLNQNWFEVKQFSFLSGLTLFLGNLGGFFATYPLAYLSRNFGWQYTFISIGFISIIAGTIAYLVIRDNPEEKNFPLPESYIKTKPLTLKESMEGLLLVMKNYQNWFPFLAFFGIYGTLISFQGTWSVPFLMNVYKISKSDASNMVMFISIGLMLGSLFTGFLSKHLSLKKIFFSFILIFVILLIMITYINLPVEILPYFFFGLGFFVSSFILVWTLGKNLNPFHLSGSATAFVNTGGMLGSAVLPVVFGVVLDLSWDGNLENNIRIYSESSYRMGLTVLIFFMIISLISIILTHERKN